MKTGVFLSTLATLAAYKLWVIGPGRLGIWLSSLSIDLLVWSTLWLVGLALERSRVRGGQIASCLWFYPALSTSFFIHFAHTYFFEAAARRRLSLFDINFGQIGFFFQQVLPRDGWLWLLALLLLSGLASFVWRGQAGPRSLRAPALLALAQAGGVAILLSVSPDVPSPSVDLARDLYELLAHPRITFDARTKPRASISVLDKSQARPDSLSSRFKKIVIIVMETMTSEALREESQALEARSFLRQMAAQAHVYERYYTSNQDSRTGMLGMLSSRVVPYEAYTEEGRDHYTHLSTLSNLAELFHGYGYETAFAVSQEGLEIVVSDMPWQKVISLTAQQVDLHKQRALCFNPYEFENGCEDKVLLPKVVDFIVENERALVYQEMIWGHASEYNRASGKSNARYYSEYLEALRAQLAKRGVLDETLLVLTADHGFRDKTLLLDPRVYQVPLFFHATSFKPTHERGLYSHIDFKDLLLHELDPRLPRLPSNAFVHVVGPTGTAVRAVVTESGGFLAYKARGFANYALRRVRMGETEPEAQLKLFDDYRRRFEQAQTAP